MKLKLAYYTALATFVLLSVFSLHPVFASEHAVSNGTRPNFILITVDDMHWQSIGAFGNSMDGITPNIDALAAQGIRFNHSHVPVSLCHPARAALLTGRYPHLVGIQTNESVMINGVATLPEILGEQGYYTGLMGKERHVLPGIEGAFDVVLADREFDVGRNAEKFYQHVSAFVDQAIEKDQPFFLMVNLSDPHKPWIGDDFGDRMKSYVQWFADLIGLDKDVPRLHFHGIFPSDDVLYEQDQVEVPGFLPDLPETRAELTKYYSSVRRSDVSVGRILDAIRETTGEANTVVTFVSDNGLSEMFAKNSLYLNSTNSAMIMRWPGRIAAGLVNSTHLVSGMDYMPTVLEIAGVKADYESDGESILPILGDDQPKWRNKLFTQMHTRNSMRSVLDTRYGYIYNAWSDGKRKFVSGQSSTVIYQAISNLAKTDTALSKKLDQFMYGQPEEFYDYAEDPNALNNLIDDPTLKDLIDSYRLELLRHMEEIQDPVLWQYKPLLADMRLTPQSESENPVVE